MTRTHERRQAILSVLRENQELKITTLAELLKVSPGTIRNDLNFLSQTRQIRRTRGGAALANHHVISNPEFAARASANSTGKRAIARRAADMVKDGDAIFLDDSTTAFTMIPFLHDRRDLTIVTNGIETAVAAARNPEFTVVLLGGIVRSKTVSVIGQLSEAALNGLHIRTAFVSCSGFSVRTGFTEADMDIAQLKSAVIAAAERVVGLVESSKFGVVQFSSFARADEVAQILTDGQIEPQYIEALRKLTTLTVCGEKTTSSYTRVDEETAHYRIGFANLGEERPFAVAVRQSLEAAARAAGHLDLIVGDNQYDNQVALDVADYLIQAGVDLAIEFHYDEKVGGLLANKFHRANIPVIAVDIPMIGAMFFGVDNYRAGRDGGAALGEWIQERWDGQVDRVIVLERPASGPVPATRIMGQIEGLEDVIGPIPVSKRIYLEDAEGTVRAIEQQLIQVLERLPDAERVAVIGFNDATVEGVLAAVEATGRETQVVCVSQGAGTRRIRDALRQGGSPVVAAVLFPPDAYGRGLVEMASKVLRGERVPPAVYLEHVLLLPENIDRLHPEP